jgi:hypothetical protein
MELYVLCENGCPVAKATVVSCTERESVALVRPNEEARLGYVADMHAALGGKQTPEAGTSK